MISITLQLASYLNIYTHGKCQLTTAMMKPDGAHKRPEVWKWITIESF